MKRLFLSILLLAAFLINDVDAACTGSSPSWTTTPDWSSVSACYAGAASGDTITVSGTGTQTWGALKITKGIHLIGPGKANLTIRGNSGDMIVLAPSSCVSGGPEIEISGFTFDTQNARTALSFNDDENKNKNPLCTKGNVHDCAFIGITTANSGNRYIAFNGMGGVVRKNTFTGAWQYFVVHANGTVNSSIDYGGYDAALNTDKAVYLEDNIFNKTETTDNYITDCQYAGLRMVWRYNTFNIPNSSLQTVVDWHGYASGEYNSCQGNILYGNRFIFTNNGSVYDGLVNSRGGRGLLYYNDVVSSSGSSVANNDGAYGCPPDYLDEQLIRLYTWNNRRNDTTALSDADNDGTRSCSTNGGHAYPTENWNYFNFKTSFTGAAGTGCGTLAARPASPAADRVGYWATNGTCSTVAGLTGDIMTYPTRSNIPDGTLYVWDSGTAQWTTWYTPYTYPHPLTAGAPAPPPPRTPNPPPIQGIN